MRDYFLAEAKGLVVPSPAVTNKGRVDCTYDLFFRCGVVNLVSALTALHPAWPPGLSGHAGDQPESELRVVTSVDPAGVAVDAGWSALKMRPPGSPPGWPGRDAQRVRPTAKGTNTSTLGVGKHLGRAGPVVEP
jgi:hypothetical protein